MKVFHGAVVWNKVFLLRLVHVLLWLQLRCSFFFVFWLKRNNGIPFHYIRGKTWKSSIKKRKKNLRLLRVYKRNSKIHHCVCYYFLFKLISAIICRFYDTMSWSVNCFRKYKKCCCFFSTVLSRSIHSKLFTSVLQPLSLPLNYVCIR